MDGKEDHLIPPGQDGETPPVPPRPVSPQRFDTRTGRPIAAGRPGTVDDASSIMLVPAGPPRRSTVVRDLLLLTLHLIAYLVVIGGIVVGGVGYQGQSLGLDYRFTYSSFDAVFWPSFAWGTLIAAQAGTVVFQRRRVLGAILGAMASVLLGSWILGNLNQYQVVAVVFRSVAVALVALTIGVSILRRPPALVTGGATASSTRPPAGVPTIAARRPSGVVSLPNIALGLFALLFVLSAIVAGTYRVLEVRGSGEPGQRGSNLPQVTRVSATGVGTLIVVPGSQASLTVTGDDNLLDAVEWETVDGELRLTFEPGARGSIRLQQPLVYLVTLPSIDGLSIGGQIEASIEPGFTGGVLRAVVGEDARLTASALALDSLSLAVRGDGRADVAGRSDMLAVEASDASIVDAVDLVVGEADVTISDDSFTELGDATTLRYRQSGSATLQCAEGTKVLSGSVHVVPQCVPSPMRIPTVESYEIREPSTPRR